MATSDIVIGLEALKDKFRKAKLKCGDTAGGSRKMIQYYTIPDNLLSEASNYEQLQMAKWGNVLREVIDLSPNDDDPELRKQENLLLIENNWPDGNC